MMERGDPRVVERLNAWGDVFEQGYMRHGE